MHQQLRIVYKYCFKRKNNYCYLYCRLLLSDPKWQEHCLLLVWMSPVTNGIYRLIAHLQFNLKVMELCKSPFNTWSSITFYSYCWPLIIITSSSDMTYWYIVFNTTCNLLTFANFCTFYRLAVLFQSTRTTVIGNKCWEGGKQITV
jgi:hypothetical protein